MRCVATVGVSMRIVRNLGILNILLLIPTLFDQYNTGPSEVNLTINPTTKIGTLKKLNKKPAIARSKRRFIFYQPQTQTETHGRNNIKSEPAPPAQFTP